MDKEPIPYNYHGEKVLIYPGNLFTKNELILRLKEMNFAVVDNSYKKKDLVILYEIATSYDNNIEKIITKLKKDNQYMKLKEQLQKNNSIEDKDGNFTNIFHNLKRKFMFGNGNNNLANFSNDSENEERSGPPNNPSTFSLSDFFSKIFQKLKNKSKSMIIKLVLLIIIVYGIDFFIPTNFDNYFLLGTLLNWIRAIITPNRVIVFCIGLYLLLSIVNSLIYILYAFGIIGLIYLFFKNVSLDSLLNNFFLNLLRNYK